LIIGNSSKEFPFQKKDPDGIANGASHRAGILPKIKRTCAIDAKIVGFWGVRFWLSRYGVRDKIFFKKIRFRDLTTNAFD
jgi:hypothetical protein